MYRITVCFGVFCFVSHHLRHSCTYQWWYHPDLYISTFSGWCPNIKGVRHPTKNVGIHCITLFQMFYKTAPNTLKNKDTTNSKTLYYNLGFGPDWVQLCRSTALSIGKRPFIICSYFLRFLLTELIVGTRNTACCVMLLVLLIGQNNWYRLRNISLGCFGSAKRILARLIVWHCNDSSWKNEINIRN